jgi:tripartite-type tricarboxylate transporter receptor subunit TctC
MNEFDLIIPSRRKEKRFMKRVIFGVLSVALIWGLGLICPNGVPAAYPEKAVTFLCGFAAGGGTDMTARAITEAVKKYFPKPMVVVNRPGAAGTIAAAEIIHAKPDGYTIGISPVAPLTIQPHRTKLTYGSPEDYMPIIKLVNMPISLGVKSTAPWKNIQEFIAYAKANPGKIRVGHSGVGSINHLDVEMLKGMAAIDLTPVPFTGGGESIPALLGEHVEAVSTPHGEFLPHVQAGKIRVLGVFEEKRNLIFPDVPTFKESGYDITMGIYALAIGPKGLSPHIVSTLHDALKKAMEDPIFKKAMEGKGFDISYEGPEDLKKRLLQDYEINGRLVERLNLKGK